jgi:hypothetical protein
MIVACVACYPYQVLPPTEKQNARLAVRVQGRQSHSACRLQQRNKTFGTIYRALIAVMRFVALPLSLYSLHLPSSFVPFLFNLLVLFPLFL